MRRSTGWFIGLCLLVILSSGWLLGAQDNTTQGFYVLPFTGGALSETGDGTYQLTLNSVPDSLDWMISTPEYFAGGYNTATLVAEWGANLEEPLTTTALLRLEAVTLRFSAGAPAFDALTGNLVLEVTDVEAFPVEEGSKKKGGDIPQEFEAGTLTLVLDAAFDAGLAAGAEILESEGRVSRSGAQQRPGPPRQNR